MKKYARIISCFLSVILIATSFTGCGTSDDDGRKENIVLEEPVGVSADYAIAGRRDMFFTEVYSSSVNPDVVEYAFPKDQTFKKYGATPGNTVKKGDTLAYSETKELDKQIESMREELEDMQSYHALQVQWLKNDIADAKESEWKAYSAYAEVLQSEPDKDSEYFDMWAKVALMPESGYARAKQNRERLEQNLKQNEELYQLENNYKAGNISRVQDKINDATIISNVDGEVVACNYYYSGDRIEKDTALVAVGDVSKRVLQTEYISKANISKALEYYAVIDGKRYELEYVNMEPEEYKQRQEAGESVFTAFNLIDETGSIAIGQYAVVVLVKDVRRDVLCVPSDSVKKEADGYYVYLFNGEETSYVPVEVGVRDGIYAEILSGIKEGDKILSTQVPKKGKNTATVTRGDYSSDVEVNGFLYYPFSEWITNPVQYGSTYLKEMFAVENDFVEKGQVLCTLEVVPDQIEIDRINRKLARLQSRLAKMKKEKADKDARNVIDRGLEKSIAENERETATNMRQLEKLTKYVGEVELKAEYDGIVMSTNNIKPGSLIYPDANIIEMANDSLSYVLVRDDKNQLNYGNDAEIKIVSPQGITLIPGKVVNVNKICLSKALSNDFSIVAISQEDVANVAQAQTGRWDRNGLKVKVNIRSEKNVLIVPKAAVTLKDKSTYVNVLREDGSVEQVSFIPGGSDNNNYWIVDGLTEGMTVCWE